ncbi:MAG: cycH [Hyphomicrobiales bacterium]|nr:cycH [Hyphomicrobiales bacterium]
MVWVAFALMTGAVVLAVLWPLGRARAVKTRDPDVAFYRSQVEEIGRDASIGLLTPTDAEAAKAEAARRLMLVSGDAKATGVQSHVAVRIAAVLSLIAIPAVALTVYIRVGSPEFADQPLTKRVAERAPPLNVEDALARIESHLAANPDDGRGWEVVAPVYMRMGKFEQGAHAFAEANRVLGATPQRLNAQAEALVYAANDTVTPQARSLFEEVLTTRQDDPTARFYLALAREQAGDRQGAIDDFTRLAADSPPDAPWQEPVRRRIVALGGTPPAVKEAPAGVPTGEAAEALRAMPSGDQQAAIRGMVDGLAARLAQDGRDPEGWLRLVRAYSVLKEPELARTAVQNARKALAEDQAATRRVDDLARELGLEG